MAAKPFTASFVLALTSKQMRKAVDTSISKAVEREVEFAENPEKLAEVKELLIKLNEMKIAVEAITTGDI